MIKQKYLNYFSKFFVFFILIFFFIISLSNIKFGLPFFYDEDEVAFMKSTLSYLSIITGIKSDLIDPIYGPLINLVLILKYLFINEFLINSLNFSEIKSKIYFNPELFIFYGRLASLTVTTISIYVLYLILRKFNTNQLIIYITLILFSTSLVTVSISLVNGKNSFYLLFFLIQIYFFIKYFLKLEKFNSKSYILFAVLGSIGWGINYWTAIVSIYAIIILHFKKFGNRNYLNIVFFLIIFIFLGPILNYIFSSEKIIGLIIDYKNTNEFSMLYFIRNFFTEILLSFKIIYNIEKNILILLIFFPFFLYLRKTNYKGILLLISILIFEPIILFSFAEDVTPQLRYFAGIVCIILILNAIIFNEFIKIFNKKIILSIFFFLNIFFIYNQISIIGEIKYIISKNHNFYQIVKKNEFKNETLHLLNASFRKNIENNLLYLDLHEKKLITNKNFEKDNYNEILKKIKKIKVSESYYIEDKLLKDNLIFFNDELFMINNFKGFLDHIKSKYRYIVINENNENDLHRYIKKNYKKLDFSLDDNKIYYTNLREILHHYSLAKNHHFSKEDIVFGNKLRTYKLD